MRSEIEHRFTNYMLTTQTLPNGVKLKIGPDLQNS